MKKSLIALAALAAVSAASAQSTVEIYGRAHLAYDNWGATGSTVGAASDVRARSRLADDSSRIGFRINEDLGGGLRAFSVIETGINIDTATANGQSGAANSGAGFIGTREAHVGIGNGQAELRLGRQNVYWANGKIEDVAANMIHGGVINAYTAPGAGFINAPASRADNTFNVVLNKDLVGTMFAGSSVWYSIGSNAEQTAKNLDAKAKAMGFTLKASEGPFAAQYDYGQNKNTNNGADTAAAYVATAITGNAVTTALGAPTLDSTITGGKLGLAYFYAPTSKVAFINVQLKQEFTTAAENAKDPVSIVATATNAAYNTGFRKQASNSFLVQHDLGGGNIVIGQYVKQGNVKNVSGASVADTGSTAYSIAYRKDLSKRTSLSASYNVINNDAKNNMMSNGGGQASVAYVPMGATVKVVGLGIQHNF
jgi:predicted porin